MIKAFAHFRMSGRFQRFVIARKRLDRLQEPPELKGGLPRTFWNPGT